MESIEIFIQFPHHGNFLHYQLNSCRRNYSRGDPIQERKLFAEIRYVERVGVIYFIIVHRVIFQFLTPFEEEEDFYFTIYTIKLKDVVARFYR